MPPHLGLILVGPVQARKVANWNQAGRITVNTNASEQSLVMAVMVLETPFGRMKVTIDRYIAKDDDNGSKYDRAPTSTTPTAAPWRTSRPNKSVELAQTGDSVKVGSIVEESTLHLWHHAQREIRRQVQQVRDRLAD